MKVGCSGQVVFIFRWTRQSRQSRHSPLFWIIHHLQVSKGHVCRLNYWSLIPSIQRLVSPSCQMIRISCTGQTADSISIHPHLAPVLAWLPPPTHLHSSARWPLIYQNAYKIPFWRIVLNHFAYLWIHKELLSKSCRTPWSCCVYWELYLCCCTITAAAEAGGCWLNATRILLLLLPVASSRPPRQQQQQQQQQHTPRLLWPSPALCCYQIFIVCRVDRADKQRGSLHQTLSNLQTPEWSEVA